MPEKVLYKNQAEKQAEEKEEKKEADLKKLGDKITKEETKGIDRTFFKDHFGYQSATAMLKNLINTDKKTNTDLVDSIQKKLSNLRDEYV